MLRYKAKLIRLDSSIEELGVFLINTIELICFISYSESRLELGKEYLVELNYQIFNDYQIELANQEDRIDFFKINNNFNYLLIGTFKKKIFNVNGIEFIDEYLLAHFAYLENKPIRLFVDRLEIAICE